MIDLQRNESSRPELARLARELAVRLLTEGLERGEDRRRWTIDISDRTGEVALTLTLAEAVEGTSLANLH